MLRPEWFEPELLRRENERDDEPGWNGASTTLASSSIQPPADSRRPLGAGVFGGYSLAVTICANCGAENPADKKFCGDCGNALVAVSSEDSS